MTASELWDTLLSALLKWTFGLAYVFINTCDARTRRKSRSTILVFTLSRNLKGPPNSIHQNGLQSIDG
jgi:hypothetical protein